MASGDSKTKMRTYGDKPHRFQLEPDGDFFYIGSEVRGNQNHDVFPPGNVQKQ